MIYSIKYSRGQEQRLRARRVLPYLYNHKVITALFDRKLVLTDVPRERIMSRVSPFELVEYVLINYLLFVCLKMFEISTNPKRISSWKFVKTGNCVFYITRHCGYSQCAKCSSEHDGAITSTTVHLVRVIFAKFREIRFTQCCVVSIFKLCGIQF